MKITILSAVLAVLVGILIADMLYHAGKNVGPLSVPTLETTDGKMRAYGKVVTVDGVEYWTTVSELFRKDSSIDLVVDAYSLNKEFAYIMGIRVNGRTDWGKLMVCSGAALKADNGSCNRHPKAEKIILELLHQTVASQNAIRSLDLYYAWGLGGKEIRETHTK